MERRSFILLAVICLLLCFSVESANVLVSCGVTYTAECTQYQTALNALGHTVTRLADGDPITMADAAGKDLIIDGAVMTEATCDGVWAGSTTANTLNAFLNSGKPVFFGMENNAFNSCLNTKLAVLNSHTSDATVTVGATTTGGCLVGSTATLGASHSCAIDTPNSIAGTFVSCLAVNNFGGSIDTDSSLVVQNGDGVHGIWGGSDVIGSGSATKRMIAWSDVNWDPATVDFPEFTNFVNYLLNGCGPSCSDSDNAPVLSGCQSPTQVRDTDPSQCCATHLFASPTATDSDSCAVLTGPTRTDGSTTCFPDAYVVTYVVSDSASNTDTCSWTYTVNDNESPAIICPSISPVTLGSSSCSTTVTYSSSVNDNCPGVSVATVSGPASGTSLTVGTYFVTMEATDSSLNTDSCSFAFDVVDDTSPLIFCPADRTVTADAGVCGATVSYVVSMSDNCVPVLSQNLGLASGSLFPVGTTTNSFAATDPSGNTGTCSFRVIVTDDESPSISCPTNIVSPTDLGICTSVQSYSIGYMDNCIGGSTSQDAGGASGSAFSLGTTVNFWTATDVAGNEAQCSFTVTVSDMEDPAIVCPSDIVTSASASQCSAVVNYIVSSSDNCGSPATSLSTGLVSGPSFPVGSTVNNWSASDGSNSASCSFSVTVSDAEDPTISCPSNIFTTTSPGLCTAPVTYFVSSSDNCGAPTTTQSTGLSPGSNFPFGSTTNTWTASDGANSASCSFSVQVADDEIPVITCPFDVVTSTDAGLCSAAVSYTVISSDNCPSTVSQTLGLGSGSSFGIGTVTNAFTITDGANSASCDFDVTVSDREPPMVICPSDVSSTTDPGQCSAVEFFNFIYADNCPAGGTAPGNVFDSGDAFAVGTTSVQRLATDAAGNTAVCAFNIVVTDNESPQITCPLNMVLNNDPGQCTAVTTYAIGTSDNCPGFSTSRTVGLASGAAFPVGLSTVTHVVTDASLNASQCSFAVTVNDNELPTFSVCPTIVEGAAGVPIIYSVAANDNCSSITLSNTGPSNGDTLVAGTYATQWTARDLAGNTQVCSFDVVITAAVVTGGSATSNVYMYIPLTAEFNPALLASLPTDTSCQMELRAQGTANVVFSSDFTAVADSVSWEGAHAALPQWVEVWLHFMPSGTYVYAEDLRLCASAFVNDPPGCAAS